MNVGSLFLKDQFEWPLFQSAITPEHFAKILCADLGVSGEFIPLISNFIHLQVVQQRIAYDENIDISILYDRYIRDFEYIDEDEDDSWEPILSYKNEQEILEIIEKEDLNSRRSRRQSKNFNINSTSRSSYVSIDTTNTPKISTQSLYDLLDLPTMLPQPIIPNNLYTPIHVDLEIDVSDIKYPISLYISNIQSSLSLKQQYSISEWYCIWCCQIATNTRFIRNGPLEKGTLCDECGLVYLNQNGKMDLENYQIHKKILIEKYGTLNYDIDIANNDINDGDDENNFD